MRFSKSIPALVSALCLFVSPLAVAEMGFGGMPGAFPPPGGMPGYPGVNVG